VHASPKIAGARADWLRERITAPFTLRGPVAELAERGLAFLLASGSLALLRCRV